MRLEIVLALMFALLVGACVTAGKMSVSNGTSVGSIGWDWNQTPQGGSDEKSSTSPEEPAN